MSDYHEMFMEYTKGIDPDIIKRMKDDQEPMKCLACGAPIIAGKKCCDKSIHKKEI